MAGKFLFLSLLFKFQLLLLKPHSFDLKILVAFRPRPRSISLELCRRDPEFNKGLESRQDPVFDELGDDDFKLAGLGVNLFSEGDGKG